MISHDTTVVSYKHPQHIRKISLTPINQKVVSYNIKNSDITVTKKNMKNCYRVFSLYFLVIFPLKLPFFSSPPCFSVPLADRDRSVLEKRSWHWPPSLPRLTAVSRPNASAEWRSLGRRQLTGGPFFGV